MTVIFRRRGGNDLEQSHSRWARTIRSSPDIIEMTFCPITALLEGITGKEHLIRTVNLYLECKTIKLQFGAINFPATFVSIGEKVLRLDISIKIWILFFSFSFTDKPPVEELRYFLEFQIAKESMY